VVAAGGDGGLAGLTYDPLAQTNGLTPIQPAQDAIVNIAGFPVHSATNTVDAAIDGVTLTLKNKAPGTIVSLTVANDNAAIQNKVNGFVSAYNTLQKQITTLRGYDANAKTAGPMLGDAMLLNIEGQLRRLMGAPVAGTTVPYTTLSNLGITAGVDGTLSLDSTKFQAALAANPTAVSAVFSGADGVATKLYTAVGGHIATGGDISTRDGTLSTQRKDLTAQRTALDARMQVVQARYLKQFNALDSLLTQMQSTSSYLTQQLATSTAIAKGAGQ
jgi:flagellar hook-associated protein 2